MPTAGKDFTHDDLAKIWHEIQEQPAWREQANREMDYKDNNQLDSVILNALSAKGIPPSIENVIAPVIDDLTGMEAKNRTDWRVQPDGENDEEAELVAEALNHKLNRAERQSKADRVCSDAYESGVSVGIGWIEVSREADPFKFPYRCKFVHRNEIWWDFLAKEPDLSDARWLLRRRWTDIDVVKMKFPKYADLVEKSGSGWGNIDELTATIDDADSQTDLAQSLDIERGWSVEEQEWRTPGTRRVCLFEVLERRWEETHVIKTPDGRVVEYDKENPDHQLAIIGHTQGIPGYWFGKATITRVFKHFFLGPHRLHTEETEWRKFNYVAVWGKREDRTNIPYGVIRPLMYLQDEVNARISKMQWLLSATRTERTSDAVDMDDEVFRQEIGRPDADIRLNPEAMARTGARFEVKQNEQLNQQQYQRLLDLRQVVKNISSVNAALSGEADPDNSGAMSQAIEQSIQSLAKLNDNFAFARQEVGDLLMTMIINDMKDKEEHVVIKAGPIKGKKEIVLNQKVTDEQTGQIYLSNDVSRKKLKVVLEEVPSTPTFRQQQLSALSEAFKSAPAQYQAVMMPHLMHLANVPNKEEIIEAILEINKNANLTEEQVEKRIADAVEQAKTKWMVDQKSRELDIKEKKTDAEIKKIINEAVNAAIESIYSATQAGLQIASAPAVAPAADQILQSAGFEDQDSAPIVASPGVQMPAEPSPQNTSPMFPPRVQEPDVEQIGTPERQMEPGPDAGLNKGIEAEGVQI